MAEARTLYLQRVVREDPYVPPPKEHQEASSDLRERMDEMEASMASKFVELEKSGGLTKTPETSESLKKIQTSMQGQIDALNRAVRRYEKRATAQTMQTDARLQALDSAMKEAISLAAAAATYSQRPGLASVAFDSMKTVLTMPLAITYTVLTYPFHVMGEVTVAIALRLGLVQRRQKISFAKTSPRTRTVTTKDGRKIQKRVE